MKRLALSVLLCEHECEGVVACVIVVRNTAYVDSLRLCSCELIEYLLARKAFAVLLYHVVDLHTQRLALRDRIIALRDNRNEDIFYDQRSHRFVEILINAGGGVFSSVLRECARAVHVLVVHTAEEHLANLVHSV